MVGRLLQNSRSRHICVQQKYLYSTTAFLFNFKEQTIFIQQIFVQFDKFIFNQQNHIIRSRENIHSRIRVPWPSLDEYAQTAQQFCGSFLPFMGYKLNVTISLPPFSYYLLPLLVCAKLAFGKCCFVSVGIGMTGTKESVERHQQQLWNYPISKKISMVISEKKKTSTPCNKYCIFNDPFSPFSKNCVRVGGEWFPPRIPGAPRDANKK